MTPNFDLFRKLYSRIAAKPEALVRLDTWKSPDCDCGTPYCVLGELVCMSEAQALGFHWNVGESPLFHGRSSTEEGSLAALGITSEEWCDLFRQRKRKDIPEKQEALERIEKLFADHNEPLQLEECQEERAETTCA